MQIHKITYSNWAIYSLALQLSTIDFDDDKLYFNPEFNFYLQKNLLIIKNLAKEIDEFRKTIVSHYGTLNEETKCFDIPTDLQESMMKDLTQFYKLTQEVTIYKINLSRIVTNSMESKILYNLLFMIEEDDNINIKKEKKVMTMTNFEIYNTAKAMSDAFQDGTQYLPVKVNFFIQKNKATLMTLAQDIDNSRIAIVQNYGTMDEEANQFVVPEDKIEAANAELMDLFNIEQEVDIRKVSIDSFPDDINLTTAQMEALMFMID